MRITNRPVADFKTLIYLFLPLGILVGLCQYVNLDIARLKTAPGTYLILATLLPPLAFPSYHACWMVLGAGALLLLTFLLIPDRHKNNFLILASLWYIQYALGMKFLVGILCGLAIVWKAIASRFVQMKWIVMPVSLLIPGYFAMSLSGVQGTLAWGFIIIIGIKMHSYFIDMEPHAPSSRFREFYLYLTGGFPCNFRPPAYTYAGFARDFLTHPFRETATMGTTRIYSGLMKLAIFFLFEIWLLPIMPHSFSALQPAQVSNLQLWMTGFIFLTAFFLQWTGWAQIVQGMNMLFGYAVTDHVDKPWLSISLVDYWRRIAAHNTFYLFKYIFFPLSKRHPYLLLNTLFLFLISVIFNLIFASLAIYRFYVPGHFIMPANYYLINFIAMESFAVMISLELWFRDSIHPKTMKSFQKYLHIGITWAVLILLWAPTPIMFNLAGSPMGPGLLERYRLLYGKMFFIL